MNTSYFRKLLLLLPLALLGCNKLIDIDVPKNQLTGESVFADSASAVAALSNVYSTIANGVNTNFNKFVALYADDYAFTGLAAANLEFYNSTLSTTNGTNSNIWSNLYSAIYACNDILEQSVESSHLSVNNREIIVNEAKFLRAFCYFYLVNLYGNIPLLLQTDVNINRLANQQGAEIVYQQIMTDLQNAKSGLTDQYQSEGRSRANKWAACTMLARVYLFRNDYSAAEIEASEIINSGLYTPLGTLATVFHHGSTEAILQLWNPNGFISDASQIIPASHTTVPGYAITNSLYTAFGEDDNRLDAWTDINTVTNSSGITHYRFPYKYKNRTANTSTPEYLTVLRISELYLIRAEARAYLGNTEGAMEDLNVIRSRAGLKPLEGSLDQAECISAIRYERQVELFGEWGHRFFDLKRAENIDAIMGSYKETWSNGATNFPIPQNEITLNPNLIQNEGY